MELRDTKYINTRHTKQAIKQNRKPTPLRQPATSIREYLASNSRFDDDDDVKKQVRGLCK